MLLKKTCLICEKSKEDKYCLDCLANIHDLMDFQIKEYENSGYDFLIHFTKYSKIKKHFQLMKYEKKLDLIDQFIKCLNLKLSLSRKSIITYIPSNFKNKTNKGYDFSEEIARKFANHYQISFTDLLCNKLFSKESKLLSKLDRQKLARNKLALKKDYIDEDVQVIYVFDDVFTTGTTMRKACELLKEKFPEASLVAVCLAKSSHQVCYSNQIEVS